MTADNELTVAKKDGSAKRFIIPLILLAFIIAVFEFVRGTQTGLFSDATPSVDVSFQNTQISVHPDSLSLIKVLGSEARQSLFHVSADKAQIRRAIPSLNFSSSTEIYNFPSKCESSGRRVLPELLRPQTSNVNCFGNEKLYELRLDGSKENIFLTSSVGDKGVMSFYGPDGEVLLALNQSKNREQRQANQVSVPTFLRAVSQAASVQYHFQPTTDTMALMPQQMDAFVAQFGDTLFDGGERFYTPDDPGEYFALEVKAQWRPAVSYAMAALSSFNSDGDQVSTCRPDQIESSFLCVDYVLLSEEKTQLFEDFARTQVIERGFTIATGDQVIPAFLGGYDSDAVLGAALDRVMAPNDPMANGTLASIRRARAAIANGFAQESVCQWLLSPDQAAYWQAREPIEPAEWSRFDRPLNRLRLNKRNRCAVLTDLDRLLQALQAAYIER